MNELWTEVEVARLVFGAMLGSLFGGIAIGYGLCLIRWSKKGY